MADEAGAVVLVLADGSGGDVYGPFRDETEALAALRRQGLADGMGTEEANGDVGTLMEAWERLGNGAFVARIAPPTAAMAPAPAPRRPGERGLAMRLRECWSDLAEMEGLTGFEVRALDANGAYRSPTELLRGADRRGPTREFKVRYAHPAGELPKALAPLLARLAADTGTAMTVRAAAPDRGTATFRWGDPGT